jgi:uncharacterized protein (DUF1697 family)
VRFVAFLRGVNVGGNSKIAMSEIVTCLENIGLRNVSTYINSGNILFTSDGADLKHLTLQIEEALVDVSGFHIPVLLRTKDQIDNLIRQINSDWHNNAEEKTDIMFLWNEVDTPDIIDQITKKPELEDLFYGNGALVWHICRNNVTKSRVTSIVGTPLYKQMTIRNINTVRKIQSLL